MTTEKTKRRNLRAEARAYAMEVARGTSAADLDRQIQAKVSADWKAGKCSACGKPVHAPSGKGRC